MDSSAVFNRNVMTPEYSQGFDKEWIFQTDNEIELFDSEEEACARQCAYRRLNGFHPITGEK